MKKLIFIATALLASVSAQAAELDCGVKLDQHKIVDIQKTVHGEWVTSKKNGFTVVRGDHGTVQFNKDNIWIVGAPTDGNEQMLTQVMKERGMVAFAVHGQSEFCKNLTTVIIQNGVATSNYQSPYSYGQLAK